MTCALVPETPNDDTPARRGRPGTAGHGTAPASSRTCPASQSTCGDGTSACSVAGSSPCRIARIILITPAAPAAACVCPRFDFTDPSHNGRPSGRPCPYVASSACASIGSPSTVPVPCPSTASTSAALTPALASAARITRCCDGPFGAVSPLDAPSWFTALPATTASTRCPLRSASESRSSTSTPAPSDHPVPSAPAPNDLHRPSAASPRCRENSTNVPGDAITVTPPASARPHSPDRSDCPARCTATKDDEHAVSTVTAGPSSPSTYDTRPENTAPDTPVPRNPSTPSGSPPATSAAP